MTGQPFLGNLKNNFVCTINCNFSFAQIWDMLFKFEQVLKVDSVHYAKITGTQESSVKTCT